MSKKFVLLAGMFILGIFVVAVIYVLRPPAQASEPIQAIPVLMSTETPQTILEPASASSDESSPPANSVEMIPTETEAVGSTPTANLDNPQQEVVIYQVIQEESEVRFSADEILRNEPFTAVGVTSQVAGEIVVNFNAATVQLGVFQVNARTLKTDNNFRDRAINNQILDTTQYEYITFEPIAVIGLPENAEVGQTYELQITGNLVIRDVSKEVLFDARVTLVSQERLEGYASAVIYRSDYKLIIPSVPQVASVEDDILLEIEFVAIAK